MAYTDYLDIVQKCYIGYYQRPADSAGLIYWAQQLDAARGDLTAIINAFATSAESQALYGPITSSNIGQVVNGIYQALFNRDADTAGKQFYVDGFNEGTFTSGTIMLNVLNGARNLDIDTINSKLEAANEFMDIIKTRYPDIYYGTIAEMEGRAFLNAVTTFSAPTEAGIDSFIQTNLIQPEPGGLQQTFTLTETYTVGSAPIPAVTAVYWGYNPHGHGESNVDNTEGGNTNTALANEGPEDGGIPVSDLVSFLTSITGLDLKELGLIDADGVDPFKNVTSIAIAMGDVEDNEDNDLTITFEGGLTLNAEVALGDQYFNFLNNLLFDAEGNSRLFEKIIVPEVPATCPQLTPIILTTTLNNGGTEEAGYATSYDDTIIAGRLELLHTAYIDAGRGYDILEIDAKGTYAQPKALLNIEEIHVQNQPNVYTVPVGSDDSGGYLDNTLGIYYGDKIPDLATYSCGSESTSGSITSSFVDITRATSLQRLVVNEATYSYNPNGYELGELTIIGIRNGATLRLEGSFTENTYLQYGQGLKGVLNLELALGGSVDSGIYILQNASVLNIDAQGVENYMHEFFAGGKATRMYITGTGTFGVDGDISSSFENDHPILIDANGYDLDSNGDGVVEHFAANTGGIDITLDEVNDDVTIYGTAVQDEIDVQTGYGDLYVDAGEGKNQLYVDTDEGDITIIAGAGDDEIYADADMLGNINITAGNGANAIVAYTDDYYTLDDGTSYDVNYGNITITTGKDADNIYAEADDGNVSITAGAGNNYVEAYTDSDIEDWGHIVITTNGGDDTIYGEASDYGDVTITAGDGANYIDFTSGYGDMKITTGAGKDIIYAYGYDNTDWSCDTNTIIESGAGDDNVYASGDSIFVLVTVNSGAGNDQVEIDAFKSVINTGEGNDAVTVDGQHHHVNDGEGDIQVADPITFNIDTGTGVDKVILSGNVLAGEGSSITGSSVAIVVQSDSDISRTALTGVNSVLLVDDKCLTIRTDQFTTLGTGAFAVINSSFGNAAELHIVVTSNFTLGDMSGLSSNIKLTFSIYNGATLTVSAEQLHNNIAVDGIDCTDGLNGKVVITGAGTRFNAFTGGEDASDGAVDGMYYGLPLFGSLSDSWAASDDVTILRSPGGFERPIPYPSTDTTIIDSDETPLVSAPVVVDGGEPTTLSIIGSQNVVFGPGAYVDLGDDLPDPNTRGNAINFSTLDGTVTGLLVRHFDNIDSVVGNNTGTRINIEMTGDVGSDEQGFVTSGVGTYVVTAIVDNSNDDEDSSTNTATFWFCDETQDVEVIGLHGNAGKTLTINKVPWGLVQPTILLEGDGYADYNQGLKVDGNPNTSDIGNINVNYFYAGAPAIININNGGVELGVTSTGGERYFAVGVITLMNAASLELNVTEGDAVISDINGDSGLCSLTLTATEDVTITNELPTTLEIIDGSGVAGHLALRIDDDIEGPFALTAGAGGLTLTLDGPYGSEANFMGCVIDGGAGQGTLVIDGNFDLSGATLTNIGNAVLLQGATLELTMVQADAIGAADITLAAGATAATLNLYGLDGEPFALANYASGITVGVMTIAALPEVTLHPDTNLTGIGALNVPEGTILNLTAAQYQQLVGAGTITSFDTDGNAGDGNPITVNITGLTQADVAGGFNLGGITVNATITVTLAESVTLTSADYLGYNLSMVTVNVGDNMTLTLGDIEQADGLTINGGDGSILTFTDTSAGAWDWIDASGFNVDTLRILNVLVANRNVDLMFDHLPADVEKQIYNDLGWVTMVNQIVSIDAGTTVPGNLIFNDTPVNDELPLLEIQNFTLNMLGGTELMGNLRLSTTEKVIDDIDQIHTLLDTLTINSSGTEANLLTGETANVIAGDITPIGTGGQVVFTSTTNNLLNLVINATQELIVEGDAIFSSVVGDDAITANDDYAATATLNVGGTADVTLGGVDTSDNEVDALVINHTGTGALNITIDGSEIDQDTDPNTPETNDLLTINGSDTAPDNLTVVGTVDLSDDNLSGIDSIKIADDAVLTITQAQLDDIGPENIHDAPGELNIMNLGSSVFDARLIDPDIDVVNVTVAAGDITLDPNTNLTGVDQLIVHAGSIVRMSAAQFQQLLGTGTIVGVGADGNPSANYSVFITGLTQADVDYVNDENGDGDTADAGEMGLNLSGITAGNITVTLGENHVILGTLDDDGGVVPGTEADLNGAAVVMADNQMLSVVSLAQLGGAGLYNTDGTVNTPNPPGLNISGGNNTTLELLIENIGAFQTIDASGIDVDTLKLLNTFVAERDVEFLQDLDSDVLVRIFQSLDEMGYVSATNRMISFDEGLTVDGWMVFNDWQDDSEVRTVTATFNGGDRIAGNFRLSTVDKSTDLIARNFDTLTLISQGTAENVDTGETANVITGDITPLSAGFGPSNDNDLLRVIFNATQDIVIGNYFNGVWSSGGNIIFNSVNDPPDLVGASLTIGAGSTADVTIHSLDTTDDNISMLNIANNGTGILDITDIAAPALDVDNTEEVDFSGTGDILLGTGGGIGVTGEELSVMDASGLSGDLNVGEVNDIDSQDFAFTAGSGVTTFKLTSDTLNADTDDPGWSFDFSNAAAGSVFEIGDPLTWTAGALNIDLGANTTLMISENTNWTALNLTITQTLPIILGDEVTLTLTAAQANGLNIIGVDTDGDGNYGTVNIINLGDNPVDLSGIDANIAGVITLVDNDVTVAPTTDLGDFAVQLTSLNNTNLSGQTIRFNTVEQAERDIIVNDVAGPGTNSSNVVWLFTSIANPNGVDTSGYDGDLGRLWFKEDLVINEGGLVESLFTTLPTTVLRVDFADITELDILLNSNAIDRIMELASFTDLGNLTFSDTGADPEEHIRTLTIKAGGEVAVANINVGDVVAAPNTDPASVSFDGLTIDSMLALSSTNTLARQGYINDNDGTNEAGEHVQPTNLNTVGNIGVGGTNTFVDLLDVTLNTFNVSVYGDSSAGSGADLSVGTITFDSEVAASTANLMVTGANQVTVASLNTTDSQITTLNVNTIGMTGTLLILGASAALNVDNTNEIDFTNNNVANDSATITITADGADDGDETITVGYTLNGVTDTVVIDSTGLDVTDANAVAAAVAAALDAVDGITATSALAVASADGDGNNILTLDSVTIDGTTTTLAGAITDATDTDGGIITLGSAGHAGVAGNALMEIDASDFDGTLDLGTIAQMDGTNNDNNSDSDTTDPGEEAFTFTTGAGVTTARLGSAEGDIPTLAADSEWVFDYSAAAAGSTLIISDTAVFEAGAILTMTNTSASPPNDPQLVIEGDVDLTEVVLNLTNVRIFVAAGQTVTITVAQALALTGDITGEGTVILTGDATDVNATTLGENLKTANVDISAVTIVTAPPVDADANLMVDLILPAAGALDDNGDPIGQNVIGSAFDDDITTGSEDDTLTGGAGNDTLNGGTGDNTFNADDGDDIIVGLNTGDGLNVSTGATATADLADGDEFVVQDPLVVPGALPTVNNGAATINGFTDDDTLIDVSLATGTGGFTLTGGTDDAAGADVLIGSARADVINGGNDNQGGTSADILTGNGGNDTFTFDIITTSPATLSDNVDTEAVDQELLAVTADNADDDDEVITINYTMNNVVNAIVISDAQLGYDINMADASVVATALATALDSINGFDAAVDGGDPTQVNVVGTDGNKCSITAVTVTGTTTTLDATPSDGTDVAQVNTLTVTGSASAGETYNLSVTLRDGTEIVADEFVATGGETNIQIAAAITTNFNSVAPGVTVAAVANGDGTITLTDEQDNDGGFTVSNFTASGSFGGSGASIPGADMLADPTPTLAEALADEITDFVSGADKINLGLAAGSGTNYDELSEVADFETALNNAQAAFDHTVQYYLTSSAADDTGLLFFDANLDGNVDGVIKLANVDSSSFNFGDIAGV